MTPPTNADAFTTRNTTTPPAPAPSPTTNANTHQCHMLSGSDSACDVAIPEEDGVSSRHCELCVTTVQSLPRSSSGTTTTATTTASATTSTTAAAHGAAGSFRVPGTDLMVAFAVRDCGSTSVRLAR
jgi:hypothetical protein